MSCATDLILKQGETFQRVVRWEGGSFTYKAITGITKAAPPVVTTLAAHGIPDQWRVAVIGVGGMREINADNDPAAESDFRPATVLSVNTVEFNDVDASLFGTYLSGGYLKYHTPVDLTGYTARMDIRDSVDASAVLLSLTTVNGRIAIDTAAKTITLTISATDSAAITWQNAVYDLELVSAGGIVTRVLSGSIEVSKEVTRP